MWNNKNCLIAFVLSLLIGVMIVCIILLPTLEGVTAVTAIFIPIIVRLLDKGLKHDKEGTHGRKPNK